MDGEFLQMFNEQPLGDTLALRAIKAEYIRQHLLNTSGETIYVEMNHLFISTFQDVVMELLLPVYEVDVIILRRDLGRVVKSIVELGFLRPGKQGPGWQAMYTLDSPNSILGPALPKQEGTATLLDEFDLAIGYLLDVECQAWEFAERNAGRKHLRVHQVNVEELEQEPAVRRLLLRLGLPFDPQRYRRWRRHLNSSDNEDGGAFNRRPSQKTRVVDVPFCHQRILAFLSDIRQRFSLLNLTLPSCLRQDPVFFSE